MGERHKVRAYKLDYLFHCMQCCSMTADNHANPSNAEEVSRLQVAARYL